MNVIDWLLDSDPSIRWQVMRDLTDAPAEVVAAERAKVGTVGWGAQLLARQTPEGHWGGDPSSSEWTSSPEWSCLASLVWLRDMGLDPQSVEARRAVTLVRDHVAWHWWDNNPFFVGEVEPCINGRVVAIGSYFGEDVGGTVDRLLTEQMDDGGWNCEQENGSTRGSFETTINVLEGLLEFERAVGGNAEVAAARERGQEYLLKRRLLRRLSTGEMAMPRWLYLAFPTGWHYDVLRVLEYLRDAGVTRDERTAEALEILASKRDADGRWPLEHVHHDELVVDLDEREGEPSRWITLRALRVLQWAEAAGRSPDPSAASA
ncbi:MAG: hypothetical protein H0V89_08190 [Deltaproteobacteria bacterium]|nr:hypothetical protein [Deltaproteobacteria bacterium]